MAKNWFTDGDDSGDDDDWFSNGGSAASFRKRKKLEAESILSFASPTDDIKSGSSGEQKPKDTRSNLTKLKEGVKSVGKGVTSSYNRLGEGIGESLAFGTKDSKEAREVQRKSVEMNTQLISKYGKQLDDPNVDPEKKKRIQKSLDAIIAMNQGIYKTATARNDEIIERTDPVKGAAAVGSIGFDALTAGTAGAAAKGAKTLALSRKATEELAAKEIAEFTTKSVGKKIATGAAQGSVAGGLNAVQEKGRDTKFSDIAKQAGVGAALGGVITFGAASLGEAFRQGPGKYLSHRKFEKQFRATQEAANASRLPEIASGPIRKQLPTGATQNKSQTTIPGKPAIPATPERIPIDESEYNARFKKLNKSYEAEYKKLEKIEDPLKLRLMQDNIDKRHMAELDRLDDELDNGKPNPDYKPADPGTPDTKVDSGFVVGGRSPKEEQAFKLAKTRDGQIKQRIEQLDKTIGDVQQNGTTRYTADEMRGLMIERRKLQDVADGKVPFEQAYPPKAGLVRADEPVASAFPGTRENPIVAPTQPGAPISIKGKVTKNPVVKEFLSGISRARRIANNEQNLAVISIEQQAKKLGVKTDVDFIDRYMTGKLTSPKEKKLAEFIKSTTDETFNIQKQLSPDIEYRQNYLPGVYDATEEAKEQAINVLKRKTNNDKAKRFDSYAQAKEISGLAPKYNNVESLVGTNKGSAIRALEDQKIIDKAVVEGLILPEKKAPKNWIEVTGVSSSDGTRLYAQKEVADTINNTLQENTDRVSKGLKLGAKASGGMQQITLSGGIPGTIANAYVSGQVMKDLLGAGRVSVLKDIVLGSSKELTQKRWVKKADFIRKITSAGGDLGTVQSSLSGQGNNRATNAFHALIDRPTFERFVPNTKLTVAENTYRKLLRKGVSEKEAIDIAAKTINVFNGAVDEIAKGRSTNTKNLLRTVFFAPKFREGIIGTLANSVKSWSPKNLKDPSYAMSRRLAVGTIATAIIYDQVNRQINGHSMFKNPRGKELTIQIPYGPERERTSESGKVTKYRRTVGIPLFPSYLTLPRAGFGAIKSAVEGDPKGVTSELGKTLASPIKVGAEVISNRDYFDRPIYDDETSGSEKLKDAGAYVGGQLAPSWARAVIDKGRGRPNEQAAATALEIPARFGEISPRSTSEASYSPGQVTSDWFDLYNPTKTKKGKVSAEITDLVKQNKFREAQRKADDFNAGLKDRFSKYYSKYGENPTDDEMWDEMLDGLFFGKINIKARSK